MLVEVTDSVGEVKVHLYSFTGRTLGKHLVIPSIHTIAI